MPKGAKPKEATKSKPKLKTKPAKQTEDQFLKESLKKAAKDGVHRFVF